MVIIAHRGSSGSAPENTLAAFRLAVKAGVDMIELDVRLTADRHLVVFHDRRLGRTVQGSGPVWTKTLAELRALDAGSWFGSRFRGENMPTLQEVFLAVPRTVGINVEVKTDGDPRKKGGSRTFSSPPYAPRRKKEKSLSLPSTMHCSGGCTGVRRIWHSGPFTCPCATSAKGRQHWSAGWVFRCSSAAGPSCGGASSAMPTIMTWRSSSTA